MLYGLALLSVLISDVQLLVKVLLLILVSIGMVGQMRRHLFRSHKESLIQLKLAEHNTLQVMTADCSEWLATEVESSVIWPWILMLKLQTLSPQARTLKLLLARDAVSTEEFRQISRWVNQAQ